MLDPDGLPLSVLRHPDGSPVQVTLALPDDASLHARVWKAAVGRITLLLLDTDIPANDDELRSRHRPPLRRRRRAPPAAGAAARHRRRPRGARLHRAQRRRPRPTCSTRTRATPDSSGSSASRRYIGEGLSFAEALQLVRAGTVFTTHTPVPAGIDRFDRALVERYLTSSLLPGRRPGRCARPRRRARGATRPRARSTWPSWACGSRSARTASRSCTAQVSRRMFGDLWPGFDADEVPITSITNGVHAPTWTDPALLGLAESTLGTADTEHADWAQPAPSATASSGASSDGMRLQLVEDARRRLAAAWSEQNAGRRGADVDLARCSTPTRSRSASPAACRPTSASPSCCSDPERLKAILHEPRAARAVRDRRQVASRRRRGQAPHPAARAVRAAARAARAHRVPARLRHRHGRAALPGLRRLAQQPAASARGVRHVGHEGGA